MDYNEREIERMGYPSIHDANLQRIGCLRIYLFNFLFKLVESKAVTSNRNLEAPILLYYLDTCSQSRRDASLIFVNARAP